MATSRAEQTSTYGWATQVVAWFVTLAALLMLAVAVLVPRLGGATPYTILTGSMKPGMPPGTLVVVKPVDPGDITIGSVVTYQLRSGEPAVVTHRVVAQAYDLKGALTFRTQGDANGSVDAAPVSPEQVKGERWYAVPFLGYVTNVLTNHQRQAVLTGIVFVLVAYAAAMFAGSAKDRRSASRRHARGVTS